MILPINLPQPDCQKAIDHLSSDSVVTSFDIFSALLISNFPEIRIPKKGDVVQLKTANGYYKYLMKKLIERESRRSNNQVLQPIIVHVAR